MWIQFISVNGYQEFHLFTDIRNVVIILSILCGCLAQFYFKFPRDYWGIFGCIIGYGLFTLLAQMIEWFGMNGNTFIIVLNDANNNDKKHQKYSIGVKSELKSYSTEWNITFTSRIISRYKHSTAIDIRSIFDVNGEFVKRNFDKLLVKDFIAFQKTFNSKTD